MAEACAERWPPWGLEKSFGEGLAKAVCRYLWSSVLLAGCSAAPGQVDRQPAPPSPTSASRHLMSCLLHYTSLLPPKQKETRISQAKIAAHSTCTTTASAAAPPTTALLFHACPLSPHSQPRVRQRGGCPRV